MLDNFDIEWYKVTHSHNFRNAFFDVIGKYYGHLSCCLVFGVWNAKQNYFREVNHEEIDGQKKKGVYY